MEFLILSLIISMVVRSTIAVPSHSNDHRRRDEFDNEDAESYIQSLATLPLENNIPEELLNFAALPHEDLHEFSSYSPPSREYGPPPHIVVPSPVYGSPVPAPPTVGVVVPPAVGVGISIDKHAILAPQVEVFRFLEAFIQFKTELIARLQQLINDNWDLVRAIINLVIGKLQKLHGFTLIFISFLRQIFEFALSLFSHFNLNLPSVSVGVSGHVDPIPSFNVQSLMSTVAGWFNG